MGKFKNNLGELLGSSEQVAKVGAEYRKKSVAREAGKASDLGCKESETRATFIVNEELLDKLKAVAYWERIKIKEAIDEALSDYLEKKKIKPRPEKERLKEQAETLRKLRRAGGFARLPKY